MLLISIANSNAQEIYASVHNGMGVSFVNAGNRLLVGQNLNKTNHFSWFGSVEGLYLLPSGYLLGVEFSAHRIYSYQWNDGISSRTSTVITYHPGAIAGIILKDNFYVKVGVNLRAYSYGGIAPGLMAALDYTIPLNDSFSIPVGLRSDVIIDSPTTFSLNATIGLRYYIDY